jgi:hypothetical protein
LAKRKYNWGKGYDRRMQEAQRKEAQRQYKRREGKRMERDTTQEQLAQAYEEAEFVTWQRRAEQYKAALEAERKISQAHLEGWKTAQRQLDEMRLRRLGALLLGIFCGLILGLIIGASIP